MKINKKLKIFKQILAFPFQIIFNPYGAKVFLDKYTNKYYSLGLYRLNEILSLKTRKKFRDKRELKINIACGDGWHHEDWIGIDYKGAYPYKSKEREGFDLNWNVLNGLPFEDNSVRMIYISHFLEHLTYNESIRLLRECYRVMESGGGIRIVVPDLDLYIKKFLEKDESFFKDEEIAGGKWPGNLTDAFLMNFYSDPVWNNNCHKYTYNFKNLAFRLKQCGFRKITRNSYMASQWEEFNNKVFDSSNSKVPLFSLYVEAIK